MAVGFKIDYARVLITMIHERSFRTSTTYAFACLILQLCREAGVPIWHCDTLRSSVGTVDTGLLKDESNVAAPWKGPRIEMSPLIKNLADNVELAQGADPVTSEPAYTTPADSTLASSRTPSSSQSTSPSHYKKSNFYQPFLMKGYK